MGSIVGSKKLSLKNRCKFNMLQLEFDGLLLRQSVLVCSRLSKINQLQASLFSLLSCFPPTFSTNLAKLQSSNS